MRIGRAELVADEIDPCRCGMSMFSFAFGGKARLGAGSRWLQCSTISSSTPTGAESSITNPAPAIETRVLGGGPLRLDPPDIELDAQGFFD
jgi:hypothetical protein